MTALSPRQPARPAAERLREIAFFLVVGGAASLVHLVVAVRLVESAGLRPWQANVAAFLCALPVSYLGHSYLTFTARRNGRASAVSRTSFSRFLLLALSGFGLNQASVVVFAELLGQPFRPVMLATIVAIAVLQFILGKWWAFRGARADEAPASDAGLQPRGGL